MQPYVALMKKQPITIGQHNFRTKNLQQPYVLHSDIQSSIRENFNLEKWGIIAQGKLIK